MESLGRRLWECRCRLGRCCDASVRFIVFLWGDAGDLIENELGMELLTRTARTMLFR